MGIKIKALLLDSTPTVASLGRLVIEEGFAFGWDPNRPYEPWLVRPDGVVILLDVEGFVPYLPDRVKLEERARQLHATARHFGVATPASFGGGISSDGTSSASSSLRLLAASSATSMKKCSNCKSGHELIRRNCKSGVRLCGGGTSSKKCNLMPKDADKTERYGAR